MGKPGRGKKIARNIEDWEAALIKAMLAEGTLTKDQIVAYFTRPDRTVNPFRIAEIEKGDKYYDVDPATRQQVEVYLNKYKSPEEAHGSFQAEAPLHPVNLKERFYTRSQDSDILEIQENAIVECKETFYNRGDRRAEFARTIAGFSNAQGGFLLFGIRDSDKKVVGVDPEIIAQFDGAELNRFLVDTFSPAPVWDKTSYAVSDKKILIIYVRPAERKPVICTKNISNILKEAEIYYRYSSETRRIKYAELSEILEQRQKATEHRWASLFREVESSGVDNIAILNTISGEVSGYGGKFLIDENLIPKLKFVAEGHFAEKDGTPTMRLVGDMEPISLTQMDPSTTLVVKENLSDLDVIKDFVNRSKVKFPKQYISRLAYSTKTWLPVYYFMRQAGLDVAETVEILRGAGDSRKKHLKSVIDRIQQSSIPSAARSIRESTVEPQRSQILGHKFGKPQKPEDFGKLAKAVMTLKPGEIDPDYLLPILSYAVENIPPKSENLLYAIAYVDVAWQKQIVGNLSGSSTGQGIRKGEA